MPYITFCPIINFIPINAQLQNNVVPLYSVYVPYGSAFFYPPENFGGIPGNDRMGWDVSGDDTAGAND